MQKILGLALLGIGIQTGLMAITIVGPEIDPTSFASAFALLAGAVLVVRGRRR
jgi:hypothetical protein